MSEMKSISTMPALRIGDLIAKLPIAQGGMDVSMSGVSLVASVASEGGVGVLLAACTGIGTAGYRDNPVAHSIDALRREIEARLPLPGRMHTG